jgi:hypothetical protein
MGDHITFTSQTRFFDYVAIPMFRTWSHWKAGDFEEAKHTALRIRADDWRWAAQSWLSIRQERREEKK